MDTPPEATNLSERLVALLNLSPVEGATSVTDDEVLARVTELVTAASGAAETATSLATAQAELERIQGEYTRLHEAEQAARKARDEAAADETLAQFADRVTTPEAKTRLRALLLSDREGTIEILNGLPVPAAKAPGEDPPTPTHKAEDEPAELTSEQKSAEAEKLIAELRKSGKAAYGKYDAAREEIRRRRPELFA